MKPDDFAVFFYFNPRVDRTEITLFPRQLFFPDGFWSISFEYINLTAMKWMD